MSARAGCRHHGSLVSSDPISTSTRGDRPLARLLALSWQYRAQCLAVLATQVVLLALGVSGLGLVGVAIDVTRRGIDPTAAAPRWPFGLTPPAGLDVLGQLILIGGLVLAMAATRGLLNYTYAITVGRFMHLRLVPELRSRIFDKIQRLSFRFYDEHASGSIINRVTGDVQAVRSFVDGVLLQGAVMLLSLAVYVIYMVRTHPGLTAACLCFTPLLWFMTTLFSRWARPMYRRNRELVDDMVLTMSEGVRGIQVIKTFGREAEEQARFARSTEAIRTHQQRIFRRVSQFAPAVQFIIQLNTGVLLLYGGSLVGRGSLTLGDLVVFAGLLQQLSGQIASMAGIVNTLQQSLAAARRVFEVLDAPVDIVNPATPRALPARRRDVRFEGVTFSYRPGAPVLHSLDLEIPTGTSLAIVGATGAGKSTLLSLIPRFYDPDSGRVLIGDVDVRELDLEELRRSIGVVFQESLLFSATVAENIAFGHPEASRASIERAASIAGADGFIRELDLGYDTMLREGAANLSGGQRQRLAIARALLLDPAILLLDDPTTAIDPETEQEVLSAMDQAMRGRTTLVVANRLSTLRRADTIVVLHQGRVVERGSHDELVARGGRYARAAALQEADAASLPFLLDAGAATLLGVTT